MKAAADRKSGTTSVIGLAGSSAAWFIAEEVASESSCLVVCPSRREAEELFDDAVFFLGRGVSLYPGWDSLPLEPVSPPAEVSAERLRILASMGRGDRQVVIAPIDALLQKVPSLESLRAVSTVIRVGEPLDRHYFHAALLKAGFTPTRTVERVGQFALKGAVIDFFPSGSAHPMRSEFRGGVLFALRTFVPDTQRSLSELTAFAVEPVRELTEILSGNLDATTVESRIKARGAETSTPPREIQKAIHAVTSRAEHPGLELLQYIAADISSSVLDFIGESCRIVIVNRTEVTNRAEEFVESARDRAARLVHDQHLVPRAEDLYTAPEAFMTAVDAAAPIDISHLDLEIEKHDVRRVRAEPNTDLATMMKASIGTGSAFAPLRGFLNVWRGKKYAVAFAVGSSGRAQRLQSILLEIGTDAPILSATASGWIQSPRRPPVAIIIGHLTSGFRLQGEKLLFIAEGEVFGERSYRTGRTPRVSTKKLLNTLSLLKDGDFVVHSDYGVGIYHGLKHITVEGVLGDFLHIDYADSRLYLPAHQIGKVQKFVAAEGQQPTVDKLGSTRWVRTKQKIRDTIITLAGDLIRLYATRSVARGWRFEPIGAEDDRFADTFRYDETPDQQKAIAETLADMAGEKPMDRLVCGDVGFGKTEVAIRASFKCTQHARQVAVLVPTTILVEQHAKNLMERFAGYPVKVAAVSRFYPAHANTETLRQVATGEVDIVVGTHRLLQPDVQFKDLGLLIIDEEHRFGVKQKERLRSYRANVDVLTLTATPIPRTLHMSLLGIRDISLINTPPVDRKAIQTYIAERDDSLVRDAIIREIRRGGQCFYIHNRVQNIAAVTARLMELVPEARFVFAHGQMTETELEKIMSRFVDKEIDVLVSTTIIESGLDVPNANTILIDRADQFGLAQLYQMRGRVGRSNRQAFAYFLVPHVKSLTRDAQERLKVLQSLDSLGIGFNLALRDLEIRGAGNLLGKEQSGSVLAVGFDMYCRILQDAVADLRGEEPELEDVVDPDVRLVGIDAFIPEAYVPDIGDRLVLYQRLSNIRSNEEGQSIREELEDRFGPLSPEVSNLMLLMQFRGTLRRYGVVKAESSPMRIVLTFSPVAFLKDGYRATANTRVDGLKALELVQRMPHRYRLGKNNTFSITIDPDAAREIDYLIRETVTLLEAVAFSAPVAK